MANRTGARTFRRAAPRRNFQWARLRKSITLAAGAQVDRQDMLSAWTAETGMTAGLGVTVMRVRGIVHVRTLVGSGAIQPVRLAAIRRFEQGVVASTTAGPYDTEHDDWFLWEPLLAVDTTVNGMEMVNARVIDVKASRRLEEARHELQIWAANPAGAVSTVWEYDLSVGIKLP